MTTPTQPEPWLRGPIDGVAPALMPAAHALVMAREDIERVAPALTMEQLWRRPGGAASAAFHLRHIAGSIDRLLAYALGRQLSDAQRAALAAEQTVPEPPPTAAALADEATRAIDHAMEIIRATDPVQLHEPRQVGRSRLPTTLLGLLFHIAEHTQRHVGQLITTAKIVGNE
ncbi:MAG TPA: DinB family protein [Gemmatimonadaceae bacterium]|nr:DinB family protein [Gemmatimonadaceae bacterium]